MTSVDNITLEIIVWTVLYLGSCITFFGIAAWVIVRGGRDILDILSEVRRNHGNRSQTAD